MDGEHKKQHSGVHFGDEGDDSSEGPGLRFQIDEDDAPQPHKSSLKAAKHASFKTEDDEDDGEHGHIRFQMGEESSPKAPRKSAMKAANHDNHSGASFAGDENNRVHQDSESNNMALETPANRAAKASAEKFGKSRDEVEKPNKGKTCLNHRDLDFNVSNKEIKREDSEPDFSVIKTKSTSNNNNSNLRNRRKSLAEHIFSVGEKVTVALQSGQDRHGDSQMLIELDHLEEIDDGLDLKWQEKSRWIKYEQDFEKSGHWGKPHVSSLSFPSLVQVRTAFEDGLIFMDMEEDTMHGIVRRLTDELVDNSLISRENRQELRDILLLNYRGTDNNNAHSNGFTNPTYQKEPEDPEAGHSKPARRMSLAPSHKNDVLRMLSAEAEIFKVLVGTVESLDQAFYSFVRLDEPQDLGEVAGASLPVRYLFFAFGPSSEKVDYLQLGRSIATMMSTLDFQQAASEAMGRGSLLRGYDQFLSNALVLPPGEWDEETLLPIIGTAKKKAAAVRRASLHPVALMQQQRMTRILVTAASNPLKRTGRPFGGMVNDIKRRYPKYLSDLRDGLNTQCLATFVFLFFACLAPAITFGGLLSSKVDRWIGVSELLLSTAISGIVYGLFSCQPVLIVGFTGPMLLFEEALYQICEAMEIEYISTHVWVGVWIAVISLLVVAADGGVLVRLISRFTEEIFSALISLLFIYETFYKLYLVFYYHPLKAYYPPPDYVPLSMVPGANDTNATLDATTIASAIASASPNSTDPIKVTGQPNTALLSLILTLGTFGIAFYLRHFRKGKYLGRTARRAMGDFGIPIAILVMVLIDWGIRDTYTEKLDVPDGFQVTDSAKRGWAINPMGVHQALPVWVIFGALVPAILAFILIFMETQITAMIVNKPERQMEKGTGYHADVLLIGLLSLLYGFLGLPIMGAAAVRSITHVNALAVFSNTNAPGEKAHLIKTFEQRLTNIGVHVLMLVASQLGPALRAVPLAVLFGVFLYMGVASMTGVQLFDRLEMFFLPVKHHADVGYVHNVRTWKMHLFTAVQIVCLALLWVVKSTVAALAFPFVLILMIPIRRFLLPHVFSKQELRELDGGAGHDDDDSDDEDDDDMDLYMQARMANNRTTAMDDDDDEDEKGKDN